MEGGSGVNAVPPSNHFDKNKVLDVKPLRCLMPVFPTNSQAPPFMCTPPSGPFPFGFSPFYPFNAPEGSQGTPDLNETQTLTPQFPIPLRAFRTSETHPCGESNGEECGRSTVGGSSSSKKRGRKKKHHDVPVSAFGGKLSTMDFDSGISSLERNDGKRELVNNVLMRFDAVRRRLSQLEDAKEAPAGLLRRADLKASNILMSKGVRTNMKKRVGVVPGIEVGDIFFFRMEMCLVGLHSQTMGGIDYMLPKAESSEEPIAISIVSSGGYDDDAEDTDVLIYSGQGGNANKKDGQASDQKLERGNLALERSLQRGDAVRVIRGINLDNTTIKVYVYDGLYSIKESWIEKGKSGCNTFKYKLLRIPGQPNAYAVWKSIMKWKEGFSTRNRLILPDLTSGAESLPVSLVNDVDDEKGPAYFTYYPTVKYSRPFKLTKPSYGCSCRSACQPGNLNCSCIRKNGGDFPYTTYGVLVSRKALVYECSPTCPCFPNCKNQVSQTGVKVRLEVFKTKDRGWGLRSWDAIRAGTFICEYAGEVIDREEGRDADNDDYVFDSSHFYEKLKWNYEPVLVEEDSSSDNSEDSDVPSPLIITAKNVGNVARFMNHSCYPNVFWQPIVYEHNSEPFVHIAFFAMKHIPPLAELTYDYGRTTESQNEGSSVPSGKRKCLCGSSNCRGYFG